MQFLITSIIFLFFALPSFAQNSDDEGTSRLAPNFYLEDLDNNIIELNSLVGNAPILLCFWSSCCKSAVMQLEAFSGLYDEYKNEGFIILAIAVDEENTVAKVKPYARSKKYKFPVLYDSDGNVSRLYYAYDVPFIVLVNKSGEIVYSHLGYMKGDEIEVEKIIIGLLKD